MLKAHVTLSILSRVDKRGPGPRSSGSVFGAQILLLQPAAVNVPKSE